MCPLRAKLCFVTSRKSAVGKVSDDTKGVTMDGLVVGLPSQFVMPCSAVVQRFSAQGSHVSPC